MSTPNIKNRYAVTSYLSIKKNEGKKSTAVGYISYVFFIVICKQYEYIKGKVKTPITLPCIFKQAGNLVDNLIFRTSNSLIISKRMEFSETSYTRLRI